MQRNFTPSNREPVPLERWFAARGRPPELDLARSGAASLRLGELLDMGGEAAAAALRNLSLDYGPGTGGEHLRAALHHAGLLRSADEALITHGATEALVLALSATCQAGDTIAVGIPSYGGLLGIPEGLGLRVQPVHVWRPESDLLDLEPLTQAVRTGARVVIVNSPHNPTGAIAPREALRDLAATCRRHGAHLILDEVSLGALDPAARGAISLPEFEGGALVAISDISKSLGLGGLRIGWLTTADAGVLLRARAAKDATTIANAAPSELLATLAIDHSRELAARIRHHALGNLGMLVQAFGKALPPPRDGLVALPWVGGDDLLLAHLLLHKRGVTVVPGSLFGVPGRIRLGLGLAPARFAEALTIVTDECARRRGHHPTRAPQTTACGASERSLEPVL